jgi:hypothetical protein
MKKLRFTSGMKPLTSDMNAIHDLTEDAIASLITALGGSSTGKVLFDNFPPSASISGDSLTLTITVPQQRLAVQGAVGLVGLQTHVVDTGGSDIQVGVFLILSDANQTPETRNFISVDPGSATLIQQDLSTTVFTDTSSRVAYVTASDLAQNLQAPPLGEGDIDYVRLATVQFDFSAGLGNQITIVTNNVDLYSLPAGTQASISDHAASHLPGGGDVIQEAAIDGSAPGGSIPGLAPDGALTAIIGSVQDVLPAVGAQYLTVTRTGDNTVDGTSIDEKTITLDIEKDGSLTTRDVNGRQSLAVNYLAASDNSGAALTAARSDHIHLLSQSGFVYQELTHTLISGDLGTIIPFIVNPVSSQDPNAAIASIISVHMYWAPPNLKTNTLENKILSSWWREASIGTVGARAQITGASTFNLELGEGGVTFLTQKDIDTINDVSTGWVSSDYTGAQYPSTGVIKMLVIGLRAGAIPN